MIENDFDKFGQLVAKSQVDSLTNNSFHDMQKVELMNLVQSLGNSLKQKQWRIIESIDSHIISHSDNRQVSAIHTLIVSLFSDRLLYMYSIVN